MSELRNILKYHIGNIVDNVSRNKIIETRKYVANSAHSLELEIKALHTAQLEKVAERLEGMKIGSAYPVDIVSFNAKLDSLISELRKGE